MALKLHLYDATGEFDSTPLTEVFEISSCDQAGLASIESGFVLWRSRGDDVDLLKDALKSPVSGKRVIVYVPDALNDADLECGFKAGLLDAIEDNGNGSALVARLQHDHHLYTQQQDLMLRATRANEMAFSAMANTADLGACLQFFMKSVECNTFKELGKLFFETMNHFNIDCVLQIRSDFGTVNLVPKGEPNPLEVTLLSHLKNQGRFWDHNQRTFVNYESISLLIKNMPVEDPIKYGQIKDNILTVVEAVDMKTRELDNFQALCNEKELMKRMVQKVQTMMSGIDESFGKVIKDIASVVENMVGSTEEMIPQLMMNEEQEAVIEAIMKKGIDDTQRIFGDGLRVDEGFRDFLEEIAGVMSQTHISHAQMADLLQRLRD